MSTQTITEFLEARIAEDEAMARECEESGAWSPFRSEEHLEWWVRSENFGHIVTTGYVGNNDAKPNAEHIARHDPARVLAECAAKRAIIAAHPIVDDVVEVSTRIKHGFACETCFSYGDIVEDNGYCDTLHALAAAYVDHGDYRQEWAL